MIFPDHKQPTPGCLLLSFLTPLCKKKKTKKKKNTNSITLRECYQLCTRRHKSWENTASLSKSQMRYARQPFNSSLMRPADGPSSAPCTPRRQHALLIVRQCLLCPVTAAGEEGEGAGVLRDGLSSGPQVTENRAGSRCLCSQDSELTDGSATQLLMRQDSWDTMSKDLYFCLPLYHYRASLLALTAKNLPAMQENQVQSPGLKILWRRKRLPTLVFLPEEFYGQRSLSGYSMWVRHILNN